MMDIVDKLNVEASYHFSSLFGEAADEIQRLRKALRDISAVTFCPKCHGKKILVIDPLAESTAVMTRQETLAKILSTLPIRDLTNPGGELDKLRLREAARSLDEVVQRAFDLGFKAASTERAYPLSE